MAGHVNANLRPHTAPDFLPAVKDGFGLRFYDPLLRAFLRDHVFKRELIRLAAPGRGERALDAGCGTGTLLKLTEEACPDARLTGIDLDARILHLARVKTGVPLLRGTLEQLPFPGEVFDFVFSTLVFHHLKCEEKVQAFQEIRRVLRPGGTFLVADFGKPQNRLMGLMSKLVQRADGLERTRDNFAGRLPALLSGAGFAGVREVKKRMTAFGTLTFLSAWKAR